jgi:hypothetical protein
LICDRHGVALAASDPELYTRIEREIGSGDDPSAAVGAVAAALDEIFAAVTRADLRA